MERRTALRNMLTDDQYYDYRDRVDREAMVPFMSQDVFGPPGQITLQDAFAEIDARMEYDE